MDIRNRADENDGAYVKEKTKGRCTMAKYKCGVCGFIYDEEKKEVPFQELSACAVCRQPVRVFQKEDEQEEGKEH